MPRLPQENLIELQKQADYLAAELDELQTSLRVEKFVADAWASRLVDELVVSVIGTLKSLPSYLVDDDSELLNFWEDVCVQVRGRETPFYWDYYLPTTKNEIFELIVAKSDAEQLAMWLVTEQALGGFPLSTDGVDFDPVVDIEWCVEDIVDMVWGVVRGLANAYDSPTVSKYLYPNWDINDED